MPAEASDLSAFDEQPERCPEGIAGQGEITYTAASSEKGRVNQQSFQINCESARLGEVSP
jgi:hypothetical protein